MTFFTFFDAFRHSGGDEATFWTEKKQNLEETLKDSFAEDNVDGFLEVEGGDVDSLVSPGELGGAVPEAEAGLL